MSPDELWLASMWPFVAGQLPAEPVKVLEIGCGPLGGFVPMLLQSGHDAVGVDPEAPPGRGYHQTEFERYEPSAPVEVVLASTSLHHVADLGQVLDAVASTLVPGGRVVVLEWASEEFDIQTARWCFNRLAVPDADASAPHASASHPSHSHDETGWLQRRHDEWTASGLPWDAFWKGWTQETGLHSSRAVVGELDARFDRKMCRYGPYFFRELADTTMADEQAAIDAGEIRATSISYAARRP